MSPETLTRVGIILETAAFFLVTPEIIGLERLRRIEEAFERWASQMAILPHGLFRRVEGAPPFLFYTPEAKASRLARASEWLGYAAVLLGLALLAGLTQNIAALVTLFAFVLITTEGARLGLVVGRSYVRTKTRTRSLLLPLLFPLILTNWLRAAGTVGMYQVPHGLIQLLKRLLTGEQRLRAMVVACGIASFLIGMAAEFAATFM